MQCNIFLKNIFNPALTHESAMKRSSSFTPRSGFVRSHTPAGAEHRVRWVEWGDPTAARVLICAHGLSRNGRDFDFLAQAMMDRYRVICPDFPGRGQSDWLSDPCHYHNIQYLHDSWALIGSISYEHLDWVGTSMGGLIALGLASGATNPLRRMVINDIGPYIPGKALAEIGKYLVRHPRFANLAEAKDDFRSVYASFGPLEDRHYDHLVRHGVRPAPDGGYVLGLDPAIIDQFVALPFEDIALWEYWDPVRIPTLILRGEQSTILPRAILDEMVTRHPGAESIEIPGCAHAPSLMVDDQIQLIRAWLLEDDVC